MGIEKLFTQAEKFFGMQKEELEKNGDEKEELIRSLEDKISSMKEEIKDSPSNRKKDKMKKELNILQKLKEDLENKDE